MNKAAEQIQRLLKDWSGNDLDSAAQLLWQKGVPSRVIQLPTQWWTNGCNIDSGLWLALDDSQPSSAWLIHQHPRTLVPTFQPLGSSTNQPPQPEQLQTDVLSLWPGRPNLPHFWNLPPWRAGSFAVEALLWLAVPLLVVGKSSGVLLLPVFIFLLRSQRTPLHSELNAIQLAMAGLQQFLRLPLRSVLKLQSGLGPSFIQMLLNVGEQQPEVLQDVTIPLIVLAVSSTLLVAQQPLLGLKVLICLLLWLLISIRLAWSSRSLQIQRDKAFHEADRRSLELLRISSSLRLAAAEMRALEFWEAPQRHGLHWQRRLDRNTSLAFLTAMLSAATVLLISFSAAASMQVLALVGLQLIATQQFSNHLRSLLNLQLEWNAGKNLLASTPEWQPGAIDPGRVKGAIAFEKISFRYNEFSSWALRDLTLQIPAGTYCAVVGPNGSGKSTLLHLLLGFDVPQQGILRIDDVDAQKLQQDLLRPQIGTLLQDGRLVGQTIWDVLSAGRPLTMTAALEALDAVGFSEDLKKLPMGLETPLPGGGQHLAGGQRQKLALARALIGKPRLLLLDEPTTFLDSASQKAALRSVLLLNCTRLLIAHRISTVQDADLILVMKDGQLVQQGTYSALKEKPGTFRDLMQQQEL